MTNSATSEGTEKYRNRFHNAAREHFRRAQGLTVSSIGIGTYLGNADAETDKSYVAAIEKFVELGGNVIDTAANYRFQRSERNIGEALVNLAGKGFRRHELLICTKGGFLPFDGERPNDVEAYFNENFVKKGIAAFNDLVGGSHCMTASYLQSQIDQSLKNMNLETIDVFYIHNPEAQAAAISQIEFDARIAAAFERLEENRTNGKLKFYGIATWNGFRVAPQERGYHSLEKMARIAKTVGGENHGFRFIQVPFNLAMPEALVLPNQQFNGKVLPTIEAANGLGISVMCSGSMMQGKLAAGLPETVRETLGNLPTDAQTSLQFVRSTVGVTTALVGMSKINHVEENMKLTQTPTTNAADYAKLFG